MTNHIHLLLEPLEKNGLTDGIHRFTTRYAQHFNRRHKKCGYVFQGRFRSILIDDGIYIKRLLRYIHLNPVEALLVIRPQDYQWSNHNSYCFYIEYAWLETDRVLSYFGSNRSSAIINLIEYMMETTEAKKDLTEIGRASKTGIYGSEELKKAFVVSSQVDNHTTNTKRFSLEMLMTVVCNKFGVTKEQLCSEEKKRLIVDARSVLARTAQLLQGSNLSEISRALNKHHGTISRLAMRVACNPKLQVMVNDLIETISH